MSQRDSGYERKERDLYETPEWVTEALLVWLEVKLNIWEPAAGSGKMARVLKVAGHNVHSTDIDRGQDFFSIWPVLMGHNAIITNPPYDLAAEFCGRALRLMEPVNGLVAMLLRTDFDNAKSRTHLVRDCPAFAKKLVLMKRICWFVEADGKPKASPSFNHAWYIWDWKHSGPPTIVYGP
jgi:hypothetical protein